MKKEMHTRSLLKAISWRIVATLTTVLIIYYLTGNLQFSTSIGLIELVLKIGLYYAHERLWQLPFLLKRDSELNV
jgi:adenylylsulfate kinase